MARTHLKLESEKYWQQSLAQQKKLLRQQRNRKAIDDFATFLIGLGVIVGVLIAIPTREIWLPALQQFLASADIAATVNKIVNTAVQ